MGNPFKTQVLLPANRQAVEIAVSGEKIVGPAQRLLCTNQDVPPSIDQTHMRRSLGEYKQARPNISMHADFFDDSAF
jgi:hypothetical protein